MKQYEAPALAVVMIESPDILLASAGTEPEAWGELDGSTNRLTFTTWRTDIWNG